MTDHRLSAPSLVKRALSGHAAIGLLIGGLMYIICLTGTLVVMHDRIQRWEQPNITDTGVQLSPEAAQTAMASAVAKDRSKAKTTHLYIRMPTDDLPRAVVTTDHSAWYVDANGKVVGREAHSWTEFVIGLHEYLSLPMTWGMMLVGMLGVALTALSITGIIAHPRIFRDAFRLRARHDAQLSRADWHNRLGVWTLPFALVIGLTGAIIGLGSVGTYMLASQYSGGDMEKIYAPIFGDDPEPDTTPAPLPNVARALASLRASAPQVTPTYIVVHDPATKGQQIQILAEHPRRLIYGEAYRFDANGAYLGRVGLSDGPIGQQAAASNYNLHFGNYGGLPVELAYILMGFALSAIAATGTTLWLQKRERKGLASPRLRAVWHVTIWGTPALILALFWLRTFAGPDIPLAWIFWGILALGIAGAAVRPRWFDTRWLQQSLPWLLVLTAVAHFLWFAPQSLDTMAVDLALLLGGIIPLALRHRASWMLLFGQSGRHAPQSAE